MTATQESAIERHGRQLLAIFPNAKERDPVKLCKKLRRLETEASALTLALCNGDYLSGKEGLIDEQLDAILAKVNALLGNNGPPPPFATLRQLVPVFINRDPRGYALKIEDSWMREMRDNPKTVHLAVAFVALHRDWGGYGILAPEIGRDGN